MDDDSEDRARQQKEAFEAALLWVLEDPRGRMVLAALLADTAPLAESPVTGTAADYYRLGVRDVGARWHQRIEALKPGGVTLITKEQTYV